MLWGGFSGGLELRNSADGATCLRGRFPYGVATTLVDGGHGQRAKKEVIAKRAFAPRIDAGEDIHFLAQHDFDKPLASREAGSLTFEDQDDALAFEARISPQMKEVSYVRDFLAGLEAGLVTGLSPGFRIRSDQNAESIAADGDAILRTIRAADLFEISAVTKPAYPSAQIEARSWGLTAHPSQSHLKRWRL